MSLFPPATVVDAPSTPTTSTCRSSTPPVRNVITVLDQAIIPHPPLRSVLQRDEGAPPTLEGSPRPPQPPSSPRSSSADDSAAGCAPGGEGENSGVGLSGQRGEAAAGSGPQASTNANAAATTITTTSTRCSSSAWRTYLDRVASFCDADKNASDDSRAVGSPSAEILRPPSDLLAHPKPVHHGSGIETCGGAHAPSRAAGTSAIYGKRPVVNGCPAGVSSNGNGDKGGDVINDKSNNTSSSDNDNKVLILLDMNGTLLYRSKQCLMEVSTDGDDVSGGAAFVHGEPDPLHYYIRPGAAELVAALSAHPRVRLSFYTSMRGVNALPAARFLMYGGHSR